MHTQSSSSAAAAAAQQQAGAAVPGSARQHMPLHWSKQAEQRDTNFCRQCNQLSVRR